MSFDRDNDGWDEAPVQVATTSATTTTVSNSAVVAVQGPDGDGIGHLDVFYQPVAMIGRFTSKTDAFETSTLPDVGIVVLNEADKLKALESERDAWKQRFLNEQTRANSLQAQWDEKNGWRLDPNGITWWQRWRDEQTRANSLQAQWDEKNGWWLDRTA